MLSAGSTGGLSVVRENLLLGPMTGHSEPLNVIRRSTTSEPKYFDPEKGKLVSIPQLSSTGLALHSFGVFAPNAAITRLIDVLQGISVHVPFEVWPAWTSPRELPALRDSNVVRRTERLERFGANLANVWHRLKNDFGRKAFDAAMHDVRAGLEPEIEDVGTQADVTGGTVALKLRFDDGTDVPAFSISGGMLAYLAFVALRHLPDPKRSLLAFDEPELHLHPDLVVRMVGLFEAIADSGPVVLATHSDRLLDAL